MPDKIDQLEINSTTYDIDLPADATPSIASLTTSGNIKVGGNITKNNLTFTLPSSSGTLTLDENLPTVTFNSATAPGATEVKSITVGSTSYNFAGGNIVPSTVTWDPTDDVNAPTIKAITEYVQSLIVAALNTAV